MSAPQCLVLGAGRMAGGFVAPLLRDAGWDVTLVGCKREVVDAVNEHGGVHVTIVGAVPQVRRVDRLRALLLGDPEISRRVFDADLIITSVGPGALGAVGRAIAPALRLRLSLRGGPVNILTFENHRRAPELLAHGLTASCSPLAGHIGRDLGLAGAAVWRTIATREIAPDGLRFQADELGECYVDERSLVGDAPPLDGSVPGIELVGAFDERMVEKLWLFNAGHAAAAYLGWQVGDATVADAMADERVAPAVEAVVEEAQTAFQTYLAGRPWSESPPHRATDWLLGRYADSALVDPVTRVGRDPRRKLGPADRLVAPALACLSAGETPTALSAVCAAALGYGGAGEADLRDELELLGPEETLAAVTGLDPCDDLPILVGAAHRDAAVEEALAA